jgi:hypothetical protein
MTVKSVSIYMIKFNFYELFKTAQTEGDTRLQYYQPVYGIEQNQVWPTYHPPQIHFFKR